MVSTSLHRLWISGKGLSHPLADALKAHAKLLPSGGRRKQVFITTLDKSGDAIRVLVEDLEYALVAGIETGFDARSQERRLCYKAAALSTNFCTAYHALQEIAHVQRGESILIHSATGGTDRAAIQIYRYLHSRF